MKSDDRRALATALAAHVAAIAEDLRAQMLNEGIVRENAKRLHAEERVGEDFVVWTDLLSRRAAVLWVLKSVYVRVLEDRGLIRPGRLLDREAQQLFERLAPNLGETAFLSWVFRDLASASGGLPELFAKQAAELAVPANSLSRALLEFWRAKDADSGFAWTFAEEAFAGELMGDLYQDLDPVVKERYALCQTPDFVRDFMLAQTLEPAIREFGADTVRVLDPACGSGHFLLDALRRLTNATASQHPDWPPRAVVDHALDRVVGIDVNDYACALARARLIMTAAELAGVSSLADAARFHPHVYWADGLEQCEREDEERGEQLDFLRPGQALPARAILTRPHVRLILRSVLKNRFEVVVGNPPYIVEGDEVRKAYHRAKTGRRARYVSAYREYSLVGPFIERASQLAAANGYVGLIVGNSFTKAHFGKPLVEKVLAAVDLELVCDATHAFIPHHGTPTCFLFFRQRAPRQEFIRVVACKRAVPGIPDIPAEAPVWRSLMSGHRSNGYEDDYAYSAQMPRGLLERHPWPIGDGPAPLHLELEARADKRLFDLIKDLGATVLTRADEVYVARPGELSNRFASSEVYGFATGRRVRDWFAGPDSEILFPYAREAEDKVSSTTVERWLWPFRARLWLRKEPNGNHRELGLTWWEWSRFIRRRYEHARRIAMSNVATHNHFGLLTEPLLLGAHAPSLTIPDSMSDQDSFALLGLLNSSVSCFWLKKVSKPKGTTSANRNHPDPERTAYEFTTTALKRFPVCLDGRADVLAQAAVEANAVGRERAQILDDVWWSRSAGNAAELRARLHERWLRVDQLRQRLVFIQEEIDWLVYAMFGVTARWLRAPTSGSRMLPRGQRAFERLLGHRSFVRERRASLSPEEAETETGSTVLPTEYEPITAERQAEIVANTRLSQIEQYMYKRLWRDTEENIRETVYRKRHDERQLESFVLQRMELVFAKQKHPRPLTIARIANELQSDAELMVVVEVLANNQAFNLEAIVEGLVKVNAAPSSRLHTFTDEGLRKFEAWESVWSAQRRADSNGELDELGLIGPEFSQGSRGKSRDFLSDDVWRLRGALNVPKERFVEFSERPVLPSDREGSGGSRTLYGWGPWSPVARVKVLLELDEQSENEGFVLAERIALLDSAWRLIPSAAQEDAAVAARLRVELQATLGADGPSSVLLTDWIKNNPPPKKTRPTRSVAVVADDVDESDSLQGEEATS